MNIHAGHGHPCRTWSPMSSRPKWADGGNSGQLALGLRGDYAVSTRSLWNMYAMCVEYVMAYVEYVWNMHGICVEDVCDMYGICME